MIAKSFSTEYGVPCIWIEDIYLKPEFRNRGIGSQFFDYLQKQFPDHLQRLELAVKTMTEHDCTPVWFDDGLLGNTAWDK